MPATDEVTVFVYNASGQLVAEYSTAISQTPKVSYTTADHLGSPRILTDENGATISRRDFMPYGEEVLTSERTAALGYQPDDVRQKFTTYERDAETNLDFAQARMYVSSLGRFSRPDPLLGSAKVGSPVSWNRYSYGFNNPILFTDPTGLWVWSDELGGMLDEAGLIEKYGREQASEIMQKRRIFIDALNEAKRLLESGSLTRDQKKAVERALKAYGTEQVGEGAVDDNVTVGFGETKHVGSVDGSDPNGRIIVNFNENRLKDFFETVAHEGSHLADFQDFNASNCSGGTCKAGGANDITRYETERRAYLVSSYIAQAAGLDRHPTGPVQYWNKGWQTADREELRSEAVDRFLSGYVAYYVNDKPLTKDNPGWTLSSRKKEK